MSFADDVDRLERQRDAALHAALAAERADEARRRLIASWEARAPQVRPSRAPPSRADLDA